MKELDKKLNRNFGGKVVRKDLTKLVKGNAIVPTYVLEYLLGQYCATDDEETIEQGVETVKSIISKHFVNRDEAEFIKSIIKEKNSHRVIDKVSVSLNETKGIYEATFINLNVKKVHVDTSVIKAHPRLLSSGVWCIIQLSFILTEEKGVSPWVIESIKPIQVSNVDLNEFKETRKHFTKEEWTDILIQSIGIVPEMLNVRTKLMHLSRLIPFCENNFNFIELGPKGTGKSHLFTELSPHGILVSGGEVSIPNLFINNTTGRMGLVGYWDVVAFDEFAGTKKKGDPKLKDIMQNYMANKSFSRGKDVFGASASMVFVGNTEHSVPYMLKHSHLFEALPATFQNSAFLDRIHCYLPGWEISKLRNDMFTADYGFIVDYLAEIMKELRKEDHTGDFRTFFELSDSITSRDRDGIVKTFSGFVKILFPDNNFTKEEAKEILEFAIESRKRIKDQLIRMDETYEEVDFYYIDKQTGKKIFVETLENENYGYGKKQEEEPEEDDKEPVMITVKSKTEPKAGQVIIRDNQTGISYKKLFADYLAGASEITVTDPYIRLPFQFKFFLEFCVMLSHIKQEDEEINLHLVTWNDEEHIKQSQESLYELAIAVEEIGINLTYEFSEAHDRNIIANNGWKIILGRGLDIFEKPESRFDIGSVEQEKRKCKACEITYIKHTD
jgi:ATP-dependent Lon protease